MSGTGHCDAAAETFVESAAAMIRKHGSKSLGIYKLLAAAVDLPDVKKVRLADSGATLSLPF